MPFKSKLNLFFALLGLIAATLCLAFTFGPLRNTVTLEWTPQDPGWQTNESYNLRGSPDITVPLTNWAIITNVSGTNAVTLPWQATNFFFYVTASNYWGESSNSNIAWTPPPPVLPTNTAIK